MSDKIEKLREDLKVEIQSLRINRGDVLLVRPKHDDLTMSPQYIDWLKESLYSRLPQGVPIIIMATNDMFYKKIECVPPEGCDHRWYKQGFQDALTALQNSSTELVLRNIDV